MMSGGLAARRTAAGLVVGAAAIAIVSAVIAATLPLQQS